MPSVLSLLQNAAPLPVRQAFGSRPFQIFLIVVIIIGAVYWYGQKQGKEKAQQPQKLPNNGSGIPQGWLPDALADEGYDVLKGANPVTFWKDIWAEKLTTLSNDQLVAVYNEFNRKYKSKGGLFSDGGTMTKWIEDDNFSGLGGKNKEILARLKSLNCN